MDTLESSLNQYLQDLSIENNNQLFKKNIFKRFINNDLLLYIFDTHLLFSNPSPFVLKFDPSLTQYINFDENFSENKFLKTNLISINSAELEFININNSTNYCNFYYENLINDNNNINMDNYTLEDKYIDIFKHDKELGYINSKILLSDFDEDKLSLNTYQSKYSKYFVPVSYTHLTLPTSHLV